MKFNFVKYCLGGHCESFGPRKFQAIRYKLDACHLWCNMDTPYTSLLPFCGERGGEEVRPGRGLTELYVLTSQPSPLYWNGPGSPSSCWARIKWRNSGISLGHLRLLQDFSQKVCVYYLIPSLNSLFGFQVHQLDVPSWGREWACGECCAGHPHSLDHMVGKHGYGTLVGQGAGNIICHWNLTMVTSLIKPAWLD